MFAVEVCTRANQVSAEEIEKFTKENPDAIAYLVALKQVAAETNNEAGEIDDWEVDLEDIVLNGKSLADL